MIVVYVLLIILIVCIIYFCVVQQKKSISFKEIEENYVKKEIFDEKNKECEQKTQTINTINQDNATLKERSESLRKLLDEEKQKVLSQTHTITTLQSDLSVANNENDNLKKTIEQVQDKFSKEFKLLSSQILEEKGKSFTELNEKNISNILNPLKEKIRDFEKQVQETYEKETRDKASLKQELSILREMNKQMSEDAKKLTLALKGDTKAQGDWGEIQVERILERAALEEGVHYDKQVSFKDDDNNNVRPDFIVYLPDNKNFIIDSKVSLTAYNNYFNESDENKKQTYLNEHIKSIKSHIDELSKKNYQGLNINTPDYVFLYLALEPALTLALQTDINLFDYAIQKNIVLVSTTTLLATMRTVSFIWKQENQKKNVIEIATESGKLYDKFVGFIDSMTNVGKSLDVSKEQYVEAMKKLYKSSKKGDTIVGRMEKIKTLGANTTKAIPQSLLDRIDDENKEIEQEK